MTRRSPSLAPSALAACHAAVAGPAAIATAEEGRWWPDQPPPAATHKTHALAPAREGAHHGRQKAGDRPGGRGTRPEAVERGQELIPWDTALQMQVSLRERDLHAASPQFLKEGEREVAGDAGADAGVGVHPDKQPEIGAAASDRLEQGSRGGGRVHWWGAKRDRPC